MSNIAYQQTALAEASYALFGVEGVPSRAAALAALQAVDFSPRQATNLLDSFAILHHRPNTGSGFSATVFQSLDPDAGITLAIRGTELSGSPLGADLVEADLGGIVITGAALYQIVDLYNYWQQLVAAESATVRLARVVSTLDQFALGVFASVAGGSSPEEPLTSYRRIEFFEQAGCGLGILSAGPISGLKVTGHSLGGHLATAFERLFPTVVTTVVSVNGAGTRENATTSAFFDALAETSTAFHAEKYVGLVGSAGPNVVAGELVYDQLGERVTIFTESAWINSSFGHGNGQMTDSTAIYALFATVDPNLAEIPPTDAAAVLSRLFEVASPSAAVTLEHVLDGLGALYRTGLTPLNPAHRNERDALFERILALKEAVSQSARPQTLVSLADMPLAELIIRAEAANGDAYRYALATLNPYAVLGPHALYDVHNANGQLDLFSTASGRGQMTTEYVRDRAEMLSWKLVRNKDDLTIVPDASGAPRDYLDRRVQTTLINSVPTETVVTDKVLVGGGFSRHNLPQIAFGSVNGDSLNGFGFADRFYGGAGDDSITALGGNDYLEGGVGADKLSGGFGNDTLFGGAHDDVLRGGRGDDLYQFHFDGGQDTIIDTRESGRQVGQIWFDSERIIGAGESTSADGRTFRLAGSQGGVYTLTITGTEGTGGILSILREGDPSIVTVQDFVSGDFGIELGPVAPVATTDKYGTASSDNSGSTQPGHEGTLFADATYQKVFGLGGNDRIIVATAGAEAYGGDGHDYITNEEGDQKLFGEAGNDILIASGGNDHLDGGTGNDALQGGADDDVLVGGAGNDFIDGGTGSDAIAGGDGHDFIVAGGTMAPTPGEGALDEPTPPAFGVIFEGGVAGFTGMAGTLLAEDDGFNSIEAGAGNDTVIGGENDDYIEGGSDNDLLLGFAGQDSILGEGGNDTIFGDVTQGDFSLGGETLYTPAEFHASDYLDGGAGEDSLVGDGGADEIYGGAGNDLLIGDASALAETFHGADYLDGGDGNDRLFGYGRDDTLFGGEGDDTLEGDSSTVAFDKHGNDYLDGEAGDDVLVGDGGGDTLFGGDGKDRLFGDSDDTPLASQGDDYLDAEAGDDFLRGYGGNDTLWGGDGADQLLAEAGDDALNGEAGDDLLDGGSGNDTLAGGAGVDVLTGGEGKDTYVFNRGDGSDSIVDVPASDSGADASVVLFGEGISASDVRLRVGSMVIDLGGGDEIHLRAFDAESPHAVRMFDVLRFADGSEMTYADALAQGFEVEGTEGNDLLEGTGVVDRIDGKGGDDTIAARNGNDQILGGAGDDRIVAGGGDDTVDAGAGADAVAAGDGDDRVGGGADDDQLAGEAGADTLLGGPGADHLLGGAGDDMLSGGDGDDDLDGGVGTDSLAGGSGFDVYRLRLGGARDTVTDDGGEVRLPLGATAEALRAVVRDDDVLLAMRGTGDSLLLEEGASNIASWWVRGQSGEMTSLAAIVQATAEAALDTFTDALNDHRLGFQASIFAAYDGGRYVPQGAGVYTAPWEDGPRDTRYSVSTGTQTTTTSDDYFDARPSTTSTSTQTFGPTTAHAYPSLQDRTLTVRVALNESDAASISPIHVPRTVTNESRAVLSEIAWGAAQTVVVNVSGVSSLPLVNALNGQRIGTRTTITSTSTTETTQAGVITGLLEPGTADPDPSSTPSVRETSLAHQATTETIEQVVGGAGANTIRLDGVGRFLVDAGGADDRISFAESRLNPVDSLGAFLFGNAGADTISGSAARDALVGGLGDDVLDGRHGADRYVVLAGDAGFDVIHDTGTNTLVSIDRELINYSQYAKRHYETFGIEGWHERLSGYGDPLPPLPALPANDYAGIAPLRAAGLIETDTVVFGAGIGLGDLHFSWGRYTEPAPAGTPLPGGGGLGTPLPGSGGSAAPGTLYATLNISWGFDRGVRIVIPRTSNPEDTTPTPAGGLFGPRVYVGGSVGRGIEQFEFADGSVLDMQDMIALAPPAPTFDPDPNAPENTAPRLAQPLADAEAAEDSAFTYTVPPSAFADPDSGDSLTYSVRQPDGTALPAWITFDAASRTFTGTPAQSDIGSIAVRVSATDRAGAAARDDFVITVTDTNDAPIEAVALADRSFEAEASFTFAVPPATFADEDGDPLALAATLFDGSPLPAWLSFDASSGSFHGNPRAADMGISHVLVTATDPSGASAATDFGLIVRAPAGASVTGGAGNDVLYGGTGDETLAARGGSDYVYGDAGNDLLRGGGGNDVLQGGTGADVLRGGSGQNVLDGGAGDDLIYGGSGSAFITGGAGNDTLRVGRGNDVIGFNRGDGIDTLYGGRDGGNVLSFGGGIRYDDLSLSRAGRDLVVSAGESDKVILKNWYAGNRSVASLQVMLDASDEFDATSADPLRNRRVQRFDFIGMVDAFDAARAETPGLSSWEITNALLQFHLSGMDDFALGGDLAYWHSRNRTLGGISVAAAQQIIGAPGFGSDAQSLRPFDGLQEGFAKLA